MLKLFLLFALLITGYVAYTGADVSKEYDEASKVRDHALVVVDPLAKKMLVEAADSDLDVVIEKSIEGLKIGSKYGADDLGVCKMHSSILNTSSQSASYHNGV